MQLLGELCWCSFITPGTDILDNIAAFHDTEGKSFIILTEQLLKLLFGDARGRIGPSLRSQGGVDSVIYASIKLALSIQIKLTQFTR